MSTYILDNRVGYVASYSTAIFLSSKQDELSRGCGITCPQFCFGKKQIWKIFSKEIKIFMKDSKAPAYVALSFAFAKSKNDKSSWKKIFSKENLLIRNWNFLERNWNLFQRNRNLFDRESSLKKIFWKENFSQKKIFSKENLLKMNKKF